MSTLFIIVARAPGAEPLYFTGDKKAPFNTDARRAWTEESPRKAYAKSAKVLCPGRRVLVEGAPA